MNNDHRPKTIFITGGTGGIGRAIAEHYLAIGDIVHITGRNQDKIHDLAVQYKGRLHFHKADLTRLDEIEALCTVIAKLEPAVDVLINNAGMTQDQLALRITPTDFEHIMRVNTTASFACARAVLRGMLRKRFGRIIQISSVIGSVGNAGQSSYAASKAALDAMTKSLAKEYGAKNITVNAVAPGYIETDMTSGFDDAMRQKITDHLAIKRIGHVKDIVNAVAFLSSDASEYITGQVLHVNGGMYM